MMKRVLVISYWVLSVLLVSIVVSSLGYGFLDALLIGTMFLPGALAARYFFPKVDFRNRRLGIRDTVFIVLGILVGEMLLFALAHYYLMFIRENAATGEVPEMLTNPVFVALILTIRDLAGQETPHAAGSHQVHVGTEAGDPSCRGNPVRGVQ